MNDAILSQEGDEPSTCELCDGPEDRPGVVWIDKAETKGDVTLEWGHCDYCNGVSVVCECGHQNQVSEGDYGKPYECEGECGQQFEVGYLHPKDGGSEYVEILDPVPQAELTE